MAPHDSDDDLDDLDDVLDQFVPTPAPAPAPAAPAPGAAALEDDFARQLQLGMEDLLKDISSTPEKRKEFEALVAEISDGAVDAAGKAGPANGPTKPAGAATSAAAGAPSLQDTVAKTLERLREADAAPAAGDDDAFLAEMLRQLQDSAGAGTAEDQGGFEEMLAGMMYELTAKEILYEPMKELDDKYGAWIDQHRSTLPAADVKRYEDQSVTVHEIVARFERPGYSDSNTGDKEYIMERMRRMQESGSPPDDIMGDVGDLGMFGGVPGAPAAGGDEGCPVQ
ncbi:Pex19 protein [Dipodascopsis tothii]|uniref:Pex19 protein n=1 Tax=Dipodascopsis tothii TaxID=44089 RepID=UPI0034CF74A7